MQYIADNFDNQEDLPRLDSESGYLRPKKSKTIITWAKISTYVRKNAPKRMELTEEEKENYINQAREELQDFETREPDSDDIDAMDMSYLLEGIWYEDADYSGFYYECEIEGVVHDNRPNGTSGTWYFDPAESVIYMDYFLEAPADEESTLTVEYKKVWKIITIDEHIMEIEVLEDNQWESDITTLYKK